MISACFLFCPQNNFFYNTLLIFAILRVNTPFPHVFITFSKFFSIFSKNFSKCAPFCGFHYTIYTEHKKSDLLSGRNKCFIHILLIFGIVLCRIAIPPAIDSARCRSMIYFPSPARHTLLSHVAPGKMSGGNPFRPQCSATSILSFLMTPRCFFVYKNVLRAIPSWNCRTVRPKWLKSCVFNR